MVVQVGQEDSGRLQSSNSERQWEATPSSGRQWEDTASSGRQWEAGRLHLVKGDVGDYS